MSEITVEKEVDGQMSSLPEVQITSKTMNGTEVFKDIATLSDDEVIELLSIPHIYSANEQFEFETPVVNDEFEGRVYRKTTDYERFIDFEEVIIKGSSNELGIKLTFTSKMKMKNGPIADANNYLRIPHSKLLKINNYADLYSCINKNDKSGLYHPNFVKFFNYVFPWVEVEPFVFPNKVEDYNKREDEDDAAHAERLHTLENIEKHRIQDYDKSCMVRVTEYIWKLFELFFKEFNSSENYNHFTEVYNYIEALDSGTSDCNYKGIPLPHRFHSDGNYLTYTKPAPTPSKSEDTPKSEIMNLGPLATIIAKSHSKGSPDFVDIVYRNNGKDQRLVCRLDELMDTRKILGLADKGFVVKSNTAGYYTNYFMELLALDDERISKGKNPLIKRMHAATRNGFYDNGNTFVYGNNTITKVIDPETGRPKRYRFTDEEVAKRYVQKGTLEKQLEGMKCILKREPIVHFKQYVMMDALIKLIMKISQCNIIAHLGSRRGGKGLTTIAGVINWGNPSSSENGLLASHGSLAGLMQCWHEQTGTTAAVMELSAMEGKTNEDRFKGLTYIFAEGASGLKSDRGKKNIERKHWCMDLVVNGENSMLTSHDNAGQLFRIIEVKQMMESDLEAVKAFKDIIITEENYGHTALLIVAEILQAGNEQIKADFKEHKERFLDALGRTNGMDNLAETFSVIAVSGKYVNLVFEKYDLPTLDPFQTVLEITGNYIESAKPDEHVGLKSLRMFKSWFDGNHKKFNPPEDIVYFAGDGRTANRSIKDKYFGFYKENYIDVFPDKFDSVMEKELGFQSGETIKEIWEELGVAERNKTKNIGTNDQGKKLYTKVFRIFEDKLIDKIFTEEERSKAIEEVGATSDNKSQTSYEAGITTGKDLLMLDLFRKSHPSEAVIEGSPIVKQWFKEFIEKI
jgi:hypothetical protein